MVSDTVQDVAQAAHDVGLAAWLGGAMYGKFAHNPSLRQIPSHADRGKVANTAWNGYNLVNALGLGTAAASYTAARFTELRTSNLTDRERTLATVMDLLMGASFITGVVNGVLGAALAKQAPDGAVPLETGVKPAPETPRDAARIARSLGVMGTANIVAGIGLVAANAVFRRGAFARPATRRALTRSSSPGRSGPNSLVVGLASGALGAVGNEVRRRIG
jgi:uncharacterized membrane protein YedE/YeeE